MLSYGFLRILLNHLPEEALASERLTHGVLSFVSCLLHCNDRVLALAVGMLGVSALFSVTKVVRLH